MNQPRLHPDAIANEQWKAMQQAEHALNRAQGDRGVASQQQQQVLDWYRTLPDPQAVNPRNLNRVEDTLGVLKSDEPLDVWWNR
jgi:hypothetical protein